ncbi:hypothetical protein, partial [Bacillus licheniformis]|uniref:hypothetical protein n=1 Tax=Bacillus licheniformis TaxID=1402 RepID=UPI001C930185
GCDGERWREIGDCGGEWIDCLGDSVGCRRRGGRLMVEVFDGVGGVGERILGFIHLRCGIVKWWSQCVSLLRIFGLFYR